MDQIHVIRHKVLVEGQSVRRVAREMGVSRNTVRRYVDGAIPGERKTVERQQPVLERVRPKLEAILEDSKNWTQGKQRLTAARVWRMLREQNIEVGETLVKKYFREWKRKQREVFVPLLYAPGDLAQVDFFEVFVDLAGERVKAFMFVMRLMHSSRDFAWLYPRQDQVCFLDGHVRAFEHFAAVPNRIAYDNLKAAVKRFVVGSGRELTDRFTALAAHYVFEASFCRPYTGHDKGGVESRGKAIRWQHLVPIPSGPDLGSMSRELLARLDQQAQEQQHANGDTGADRFAAERVRMLPLPHRAFRSSAIHLPVVTRRSLARIENAHYSVPCRWHSREVTAYVGVDAVELIMPDGERILHPRKRGGERSVDYRHYLPELARKPQAVRQVAAELIEQLGEPFATTWRLLVDLHGPMQAARIFAQVCEAIVEQGEATVAGRLRHALRNDVPLTLALAPALEPETTLSPASMPSSLEGIEVDAACAADFDAILGGKR